MSEPIGEPTVIIEHPAESVVSEPATEYDHGAAHGRLETLVQTNCDQIAEACRKIEDLERQIAGLATVDLLQEEEIADAAEDAADAEETADVALSEAHAAQDVAADEAEHDDDPDEDVHEIAEEDHAEGDHASEPKPEPHASPGRRRGAYGRRR